MSFQHQQKSVLHTQRAHKGIAIRPALQASRLMLVAGGIALVFTLIIVRLFLLHLSTIERDAERASAASNQTSSTPLPLVHSVDGATSSLIATSTKRRADILDRNGLIVATDLKKPSLCANGRLIRDPDAAAMQLHSILPDLDMKLTFQRLKSDKACKFIKRAITRDQQYRINRLGIVGLDFREEDWRVYPHANLTAHTVGFANPENIGLSGVEQSLNRHLTQIDEPIELALDVRVQSILRDELINVIDLHDAKAASGVLLDANTSEVVAMVSLPDFDPNQISGATSNQLFNKASLGVYELGSVVKLFTVAMGLESGRLNLNDQFEVAKPLRVEGTRFTIEDFEWRPGPLNAEEVLRYSSNIGAARIAEAVGRDVQQRFLRDIGLLTQLNTELPEVGTPIYPAVWRDVNTLTISYGHGISFSPLQLASSTATLVNGGVYRAPTFLKWKNQDLPVGSRVLSQSTSKTMRRLMESVVEDGSGRRARPLGYGVGGKTGTAEKPGSDAYSETKQLASFLGAFPISDPKYVLIVVVDEPKPNLDISKYATAGVVAAPVARQIIERAAPLLNITPDFPEELMQANKVATDG